jgi:hypothetical protein
MLKELCIVRLAVISIVIKYTRTFNQIIKTHANQNTLNPFIQIIQTAETTFDSNYHIHNDNNFVVDLDH